MEPELYTETYDADDEIYLANLSNKFLVKNEGVWHNISDNKCGACFRASKGTIVNDKILDKDIIWPRRCKCGGLVHIEQKHQFTCPEKGPDVYKLSSVDKPEYACDKCNDKYKVR